MCPRFNKETKKCDYMDENAWKNYCVFHADVLGIDEDDDSAAIEWCASKTEADYRNCGVYKSYIV